MVINDGNCSGHPVLIALLKVQGPVLVEVAVPVAAAPRKLLVLTRCVVVIPVPIPAWYSPFVNYREEEEKIYPVFVVAAAVF